MQPILSKITNKNPIHQIFLHFSANNQSSAINNHSYSSHPCPPCEHKHSSPIRLITFNNQCVPHNNAIKSEALYTGKQDIEKSSEFLVIMQSQLFTIAVSCCKKSS